MQRIKITHTTTYAYSQAVRLGEHKLLVRPREGHDIRIEASALRITPEYDISWQRDVYNNSLAIVNFRAPSQTLEIISSVTVEQYEGDVATLTLADSASVYPFDYPVLETIDLLPYQTAAFDDEEDRLRDWLGQIYRGRQRVDTLELLNQINRSIVDQLGYIVRNEPGVQAPSVTLSRGKGSCRDLSTLFIEACRQLGFPSRFVSGYLVSSAAVDDVATTHAWAEVFLPGVGWRGFDSTSGQLVGGDHIAVAVHRHPEAIPPVSGTFFGPLEPKPKLDVDVRVTTL